MRSGPLLLKRALFARLLLVTIFVMCAAGARAQSEEQSNALATKPWNIAVFATGGFPFNYRLEGIFSSPNSFETVSAPISLQFFSAGVHVGAVLTKPHGPAFLRGQYEMDADLTPFWLAHWPSQAFTFNNGARTGKVDGENRFGIGLTPFLCRWNFQTQHRLVPWLQLGGGLLWTNHKFPQFPYRYDDTSVINFTPQAGFGFNFFVKPHRSFFFEANAVHISNAGLGADNPGINLTAQFTLGYSWWK
jgi:lipid A 3-O-deacylase